MDSKGPNEFKNKTGDDDDDDEVMSDAQETTVASKEKLKSASEDSKADVKSSVCA
jgi:hypothetical protein